MHAHPTDRNTREAIRDEALRLFALHGPDAVTIRRIAEAARVSPALVIRHYHSREGLHQAVDTHVLTSIARLYLDMEQNDAMSMPPSLSSDLALRHLPTDSPIPRYVSRMLVEEGAAAHNLFGKLLDIVEAALEEMVTTGKASPGTDKHTRAAVLAAHDLSLLLLRDLIGNQLGIDPLSREGLTQWTTEVQDIYANGLCGRQPDAAAPR